jgi:hypothetical protein
MFGPGVRSGDEKESPLQDIAFGKTALHRHIRDEVQAGAAVLTMTVSPYTRDNHVTDFGQAGEIVSSHDIPIHTEFGKADPSP